MDLRELHPKRFFLETWQRLDDEAAELRAKRTSEGQGYDFRPLWAFAWGAVCLTLMEYYGMPRNFQAILEWGANLEEGWFRSFCRSIDPEYDGSWEWWEFVNHAYWAAWRVLGFLILPLPAIWLSKERFRDQFFSTQGFRDKLWIYLMSYLVVFVCVIGVSFTEGFQTYYPFYKQCHRSWLDLLAWQLFYLAQFFSLEFFFRGWWLRASRSLGSGAIFAMTVPYVMLHFGKEFPETIGAIFAGIFLGTLAMRTRSIWGGFLVHSLVAVSMDVASLLQGDGLPTTWLPPFW